MPFPRLRPKRKERKQEAGKAGAHEAARTKHVPRLQEAATSLDLELREITASNKLRLHLLQGDSSTTSLARHKTSLPFMSSQDRDTRISFHSNVGTMDGISRTAFHLAVRCHRVQIPCPKATASEICPRTTGCHRNQLVASSLTIKGDQMSASELSRLLKRMCHTHNHNRLHSRLLHQWSSLHAPMCPSRNLNQRLPWTLMSTIRRSHGVQDLRENVHWPIEHQRLLQYRRQIQLQKLKLWLHKNHGVQALQVLSLKIRSWRGNPKLSRRLLFVRRSPDLLLPTKSLPESSAPPRSNRDLVFSPRLRTLPDRMLCP
jgi:hypothetical protein